ncbi:uncharacterized protein LOC112639964 [Camponotus floridanus]|uniref:uncharacterized protein LOC112639964 n=1 Tax=Camponotus floridanus TaxID=104421 RepID=UPI000DC6906B|nr:uncharacterized protein LOC112639964 [Camponotus floridanus]
MYNGLGSVWIQCPAAVANQITQEGNLKLGWTIARTKLLRKRPLQCYKCWAYGHVKFSCTFKIDRRRMCYYCGMEGHSIKNCCAEVPSCAICRDQKLPHRRVGAKGCSMEQSTTSGKPLPRIKLTERRKAIGMPGRRPENMEIEDAI